MDPLLQAAEQALRRYEQWEGELILNHKSWSDGNSCPRLTQEQWDELGDIQRDRIAVLSRIEAAKLQEPTDER